MANIQEEVITIKLSKLHKSDAGEVARLITKEFLSAIEQVAEELVGSSVIVEVTDIEGC